MNEFLRTVKGALLYNIGKFVQRTKNNPFEKADFEWGLLWLSSNEVFKDDPVVRDLEKCFRSNGEFSNISLILNLTNKLLFPHNHTIASNTNKSNLFAPLVSPFFKIRNPNNLSEHVEEIPYLNLKRSNNIEQVVFTRPSINVDSYETLQRDFENELKAFKSSLSINILLMLIEKYFSNVPIETVGFSDKKDERRDPDISLFDISKSMAAIAGCLFNYYREIYPDKWNNGLLKDEVLNLSKDENCFLLIGGDISGIQKFIYTITSKGALRSLKGRSFFLELLTEHLIVELIESLNLTRCNIIFAGGGRFYILSHNTQSATNAIDTVRKDAQDYLFEEFKGNLHLNLTYVPFGSDGFIDASSIWTALSRKIESLKKKKWDDRLNIILMPEGQHSSCLTEQCEICFREDLPISELKRVDDTIKVCHSCRNQYYLGDRLTAISKSDYPVIYKFSSEPPGDYIKIGRHYYKFEKNIDKELSEKATIVYLINNYDLRGYIPSNPVYISVGIYQHESIKELSDATKVFGIGRIAVLRMDVDNLGKIFASAVPNNERNFVRMASISRGLNLFFKYYLNKIVECGDIEPLDIVDRGVKKTGRMVSIVYSGGDDLFIIGHWLDVTETACDIKRYFERFTGNKFLTISGGISVNYENYPVYQYARDAEEAEKRAKDGGRDALAIFSDKRFTWNIFDEVINRIKLFMNFLIKERDCLSISEDRLSKSFFYRLYELSKQFDDKKELILPKVAYLISRARFKDSDREYLEKIKEVIMKSSKEEWEINETVALLILMLSRKGGQENG